MPETHYPQLSPKPKVLITGASQGIGRALVLKFAAEGFHVIGCARGAADLDALKTHQPELETHTCDVSDKAQVQALGQHLLDTHGGVDLLINNAGHFVPGNMMDEADEVFESMVLTNVHSAYYLTKLLVRPMIAHHAGTIINICSTASQMAYPSGGTYAVTKFALLGFTKSLRQELRPHNIRVVAVMPGPTYTRSWEGVDIPEVRFMTAESVADAVWTAWALPENTVMEEIVLRPLGGDLV